MSFLLNDTHTKRNIVKVKSKSEVIALLERMAILTEMDGQNPFKSRAYHNAAENLKKSGRSIEDLIESNELSKIPGFGAAITEKVTQYAKTGKRPFYTSLTKKYPESLFDLMDLEGLGPKKVAALYKKLHIKTLRELEYACKENRLIGLEGFGEKMQAKVLRGIEHFKKVSDKHLYDEALEAADYVMASLKKLKDIQRLSVCGSLRRHKEVIGDVDILASSQKPDGIMKKFCKLQGIDHVIVHGPTKSSIMLESGIQVDLRIVSDKEFPFALHYFTGSKEHNITMRARAQKKGLKLNEYGLFKGKKSRVCKDEADIFKALGLTYIPPELREDIGEIEAAEKSKIPKLLEEKDIRGVFHVHSTYSDGSDTLTGMIQTAVDMGYEYVGISDHSQSAFYASGLKEADLKKQWKELDKLQKKFSGKIRIFRGIESDILKDGELDYPDRILKQFDFVIASVHSRFQMDKKAMTRRITTALKNKYTTMLGHPTGRLLLSREPYALDMEEILKVAHEESKIIELNANPHRFDLDWRLGPLAHRYKIKVAINPDAHSTEGMAVTPYGVGIARKAGFTKKDVFNTLTVKQMEKALAH